MCWVAEKRAGTSVPDHNAATHDGRSMLGSQQMPQASQQLEDTTWESSDEFRMYHFKITLCSKRYNHDWSACPYAHVGERACRRDPQRHGYTSITCLDMLQRGKCARGDACTAAHSVFEYWLHPHRYRTEMCKVGSGCNRRICFFAHEPSELRPLPAHLVAIDAEAAPGTGGKYSLSAALPGGAGGKGGCGSSGNDGGGLPAPQPQQQQNSGTPVRVISAPAEHPARAGSNSSTCSTGAGSSLLCSSSGLSSSNTSGLEGPGGWTPALQQQGAAADSLHGAGPYAALHGLTAAAAGGGGGNGTARLVAAGAGAAPQGGFSSSPAVTACLQTLQLGAVPMSLGAAPPLGPPLQHQQQQMLLQMPTAGEAAAGTGGWGYGATAACPLGAPGAGGSGLQQHQDQQQWLAMLAMQQRQQQQQGIPVCAGLATQLSLGEQSMLFSSAGRHPAVAAPPPPPHQQQQLRVLMASPVPGSSVPMPAATPHTLTLHQPQQHQHQQLATGQLGGVPQTLVYAVATQAAVESGLQQQQLPYLQATQVLAAPDGPWLM